MTNTKDEAKPSETPEKPASNKQENDALPNTEKNDRMNTSRNRSMWGNQNPKCDINSETRHYRAACAGLPGAAGDTFCDFDRGAMLPSGNSPVLACSNTKVA